MIANSYERPQCSACFILPVEDTLDGENGIAETLMAETRVFKRGSGAGANFSRVRERGAPTASGHASSGVMSFLEVLDRNAGSIKSGSVARRAAKMVTLDVDHPEIEAFIEWKVLEEYKVRCLVEGSKKSRARILPARMLLFFPRAMGSRDRARSRTESISSLENSRMLSTCLFMNMLEHFNF